jgi:hypothetical protein
MRGFFSWDEVGWLFAIGNMFSKGEFSFLSFWWRRVLLFGIFFGRIFVFRTSQIGRFFCFCFLELDEMTYRVA